MLARINAILWLTVSLLVPLMLSGPVVRADQPNTRAEARYLELQDRVRAQTLAGDSLAAVDSAALASDAAREAFGDDDIRTLGAREQYASSLLGVGRHVEALPLLREVVQVFRERPDVPPAALASSLSDLAVALEQSQFLQEAETLYREALETQRKASGPEAAETATVMHNFASLQRSLGNLDEAQQLGQEALRVREKTLGPRHILTIQSLHALGATLLAKQELSVAAPLIRSAFARANAEFSENASLVGETNESMVFVEAAAGNLEAALVHAQRAADVFKKIFGPLDPRVVNAEWLVADILAARGGIEEASAMHADLLARTETAAGMNSIVLADLLRRRAKFLLAHGDFGEATESLERAIAISQEHRGRDDRQTMAMVAELARLVGIDGNPARCAALSRELLAFYERNDGPASIDVAATLNTLGLCENKIGHHREAQEAFERAVSILVEKTGPTSGRTLSALFNLAQHHFEQKNFREAEAIIQDAFASMGGEENPDHMELALYFIDLHAKVLRAEGRIEEAREAEKVIEQARREEQQSATPR